MHGLVTGKCRHAAHKRLRHHTLELLRLQSHALSGESGERGSYLWFTGILLEDIDRLLTATHQLFPSWGDILSGNKTGKDKNPHKI